MRSMFSRKFVLLARGLPTPASLQLRSPRVGFQWRIKLSNRCLEFIA